MKTPRKKSQKLPVAGALALKDAPARAGKAPSPAGASAMVRTQIYLSQTEYDFLQVEASRCGEPMAAVIRSFIDEKMALPEEAWSNNPMLAPVADDPGWEGHEDGARNHDHYIYGSPKRWIRKRGKWVAAPALPEDYYDNPKSRAAYDALLETLK